MAYIHAGVYIYNTFSSVGIGTFRSRRGYVVDLIFTHLCLPLDLASEAYEAGRSGCYIIHPCPCTVSLCLLAKRSQDDVSAVA